MKNAIFLVFCCLPLFLEAQQNGQLDNTFGDHGISAIDYFSFESLTCAAIQPDGKIVVAGQTGDAGHSKLAVLRLLPNGALDQSFASGGIFTASEGPRSNVATTIALANDGAVVVAGNSIGEDASVGYREKIFMIKLNANGVLESSFSPVSFDLGNDEKAVSVKIGTDGKIYLVGNTLIGPQSDIIVFRFNANGTPDLTFGFGGSKTLTELANSWNYCYDMLLQPDGKILMAGETIGSFNGSNFNLIRLDANGNYDASFSGDGIAANSISAKDDVPLTLELLPDGKILAGGYSVDAEGNTKFTLVKYTASGVFDNSFGTSGKVITALEYGYGAINDIGVSATGEIYAVGTAKNHCTMQDWVIAKYSASGILQTDFGEQGFLGMDYDQHYDGVGKAQMLPDGKMIVAGTGVKRDRPISDFLVARFVFSSNVGTENVKNLVTGAVISPNPVSGAQMSLQFTLQEESDVDVTLYSTGGQLVGSLLQLSHVSGEQQQLIELPSGLPNGCYLVSVQTAQGRTFLKIIVQN